MPRLDPPLDLGHSPLVLVLAQVRFSTVLKMETFVPDIQEAIRTQGFPEYAVAMEYVLSNQPLPGSSMRPGPTWKFGSGDGRQAFILQQDSMALLTTDYQQFEDFRVLFRIACEAVLEHSQPTHANRIGLRYINHVIPSEGKALRDYLAPPLAGMPSTDLSREGAPVLDTLCLVEVESLASEDRRMRVRARQIPGERVWLPDNFSEDMIRLPLQAYDRTTAYLDIDAYSSLQRPFEVEAVLGELNALHRYTDNAFRKATKKEARLEWGNPS